MYVFPPTTKSRFFKLANCFAVMDNMPFDATTAPVALTYALYAVFPIWMFENSVFDRETIRMDRVGQIAYEVAN